MVFTMVFTMFFTMVFTLKMVATAVQYPSQIKVYTAVHYVQQCTPGYSPADLLIDTTPTTISFVRLI